MMEHLQEIEDDAARNGVNTYQTQMEVLVLSLLSENRHAALTEIEEARAVSLDHVRTLGSAYFSVGNEAKSGRIAIALLESSFDRMRTVIESPDDDAV